MIGAVIDSPNKTIESRGESDNAQNVIKMGSCSHNKSTTAVTDNVCQVLAINMTTVSQVLPL